MTPPTTGATDKTNSGGCGGTMYLVKNGFLLVLRRLFAALGHLVGRFPYAFILLTLLITCLSSGMTRMHFSTRMRDGYTPMDAPSRYETAVYRRFHGTERIQPQRTMMMVLASDGGTMLRRRHLAAAVNITDYIYRDFVVQVDGKNVTYDQLCGAYCDINLPTKMFKTAFEAYLDEQASNGTSSSAPVRITYPETRHNNIPIQLERFLYGVRLTSNGSDQSGGSNMEYVKIVTGFFFADASTEHDNAALTTWELALFEFVYGGDDGRGHYDRSLVTMEVIGDKMMGTEMIKSGTTLVPYFGIGFLLMVLFVATTVIGSAAYHQSLHCGTVLVALGTLISPLFAISTTFGLISYMQYEIYPIIMVIPFLVLAIGVDDAFLMNHSWHQTIESMPDGYQRIPDVMSAVFVDVGPSITITSLTNTLAFGIGSTMSTPIIETFCRATAIAMALDYAFELMCFGSLLAISGRFEKSRKHTGTGVVKCENGSTNVKTTPDPTTQAASNASSSKHHRSTSTASRISLPSRPLMQKCGHAALLRYCELLTEWWFRLALLALMAVYWTLAVVGAARIRPYISSQKILPRDTPLRRPDALLHDYVWMEYHALHVFIDKPPDLGNSAEMDRFFEMIHTLESMECSKGAAATQLWLRDYLGYLDGQQDIEAEILDTFGVDADEYNIEDYYEDETDKLGGTSSGADTTTVSAAPSHLLRDYSAVPAFLDIVFYQHWRSFVKLGRDPVTNATQVAQFELIMGFKNVSTWIERTMLMDHWRRLVRPYQQAFNVTLWQSNTYIYDAILSLKYYAFWTVIYTLGSMLFVCLLFIPSLRGVVVGGAAIVSISSGVIGYLTWWGLDLDPVTMSSTLMSIGFSVDFTAHVSYHYQRASQEIDPNNNSRSVKVLRLAFTLGSVGWPMFQAGASTVLCILPLVLHNGYVPSVFVKSIVLVVGWGLLHGLVVLPCVLGVLPDCCPNWGAGGPVADTPAREMTAVNGGEQTGVQERLLGGEDEQCVRETRVNNGKKLSVEFTA